VQPTITVVLSATQDPKIVFFIVCTLSLQTSQGNARTNICYREVNFSYQTIFVYDFANTNAVTSRPSCHVRAVAPQCTLVKKLHLGDEHGLSGARRAG